MQGDGTPVAVARGVREEGSSLIEVVVAAGVLVAGIAAVLQLFVLASRATADARDATYQTVLALQKIEELRAATFPGPGAATEWLTVDGAVVTGGSGAGRYERSWTLEPLAAQPAHTLVMTVTVGRRGPARRAVRLVTLLTRSDP